MSEILGNLPQLLQSPEAAQQLTAEQRATLAEIVAEAHGEKLEELAAVVEDILQQQAGHTQALFTRALLAERNNQPDVAGNIYLQLAQQAASRKDWDSVVDLCMRAMPLTGDYRLVRLLRRAGQAGADVAQAMEMAYEECADSPDLQWERSQEAEAAGETQEALQFALGALEGYVAIKEEENAADPLLRILEADDRTIYERLLHILRRMASAGMDELVATALELAAERFFALDLAPDLAETLAWILERCPELSRFRKLYAQAVVFPLAHREQLAEAIAESGLDNPDVPLADALTAFQQLAAFSPGAFVWHRSWGVGLIKRREHEEIFIDFEERPGHRMALSLAQQVLQPLSPDSLAVQRATNLDGLRRIAQENPAEIIYRLIVENGGEICTADIKLRLTPWLISEEDWSQWWRQARKAAEADPRLDCSQAFRHLYCIAKQGADTDVSLLPLDKRKGVKGAVSYINRLLAQHPHLSERARLLYSSDLQQWLADSEKPEDWIRALPLLIRWHPQREAEWRAAAERAFSTAPLTLAASMEDQQLLLDLGLSTNVWMEAAFSALASRFEPIRQQALQALVSRAGESLWNHIEDLLQKPGRPQQKIAIAEIILNKELRRAHQAENELPINPWLLLAATLSVVHSPTARTGQGAALRLLRPNSPLASWLKQWPFDAQAEEWLAPFRRRPIAGEIQPQLEAFFKEIGQPQLAFDILSMHQKDTSEEVLPELDPRLTLMTRATLEAQTQKLRELERALAVEIPQEIAKARALGDLSENAEYHAARERQGITKALYDKLSAQLQSAVAIEDIPRPSDIASVGKLVRLRNVLSGEEQEIWILGEGDSHYGPHVVSYKAPLGQALVGKREGDIVEVPHSGERLEILSIEEKLP